MTSTDTYGTKQTLPRARSEERAAPRLDTMAEKISEEIGYIDAAIVDARRRIASAAEEARDYYARVMMRANATDGDYVRAPGPQYAASVTDATALLESLIERKNLLRGLAKHAARLAPATEVQS